MENKDYRCGRINIHPNTNVITECLKLAVWISPPRLNTIGKLKVCDECKKIMESEYRKAGRIVEFTYLYQKESVLKDN